MHNYRGFQFGLSLLILAAFAGLIGFVIVYHYATYERPTQHFAIVIDAGSTQTRSNLFTIQLDTEALADYADYPDKAGSELGEPLSKLFQVRQVDSCVNGGPLASIQSPTEAQELVRKCLERFSLRIKKLDLRKSREEPDETDGWVLDGVADDIVANNRRVNSLTHLHLGATAGMRALLELNQSRAEQKLAWIDEAIGDSNNLVDRAPYINKGYVGILKGSDEAAFGWSSVNFVCEQLRAGKPGGGPHLDGDQPPPDATYQTPGSTLLEGTQKQGLETKKRESVGTLELGGASAQMAYEIQNDHSLSHRQDLQVQELELFNSKYKLATRSDLCLGMSQAILRTKFVLLRDYYNSSALARINSTSDGDLTEDSPSLELANPCLQKAAKVQLNNADIRDFLHGPCLVDAVQDGFKEYLLRKSELVFVGSGLADECGHLLSRLIDPEQCRRYFPLCPAQRNQAPPPANMSFVTISGYNKALLILDLERAPVKLGGLETSLEREIGAKLGGFPIEYQELVEATRKFCSLNVDEFGWRYPTMNKRFYPINCLQLVYIDKLLTEFYLFEPATSWRQIKFLIFPGASLPAAANQQQQQRQQEEIGWTLGLLLNATSAQYNGSESAENTIFHHHSASVLFVMRATIFLMLACVLLAVSLIVLGVLAVRRHHRKAYISHPLEDEPRI